MFIFNKLILIFFIFLINGCTLNKFEKIRDFNNFSIEIYAPNDKYNLYFKENLKRYFNVIDENAKYLLKTIIKFESTQTLSVSGQNVLKSTKAKIDYQLTNKNTNKVVKSGSISTFPALSSLSNSLYTQDKSVDHIKERLTKSSAKSLYKHIKIIIRRLK